MIPYRFRLDVTKNGVQGNIYIRKNDLNSRSIQVRLTDADGVVELTDDNSAILAAAKPDGTFVYVDMNIYDNYIECELPVSLATVAGRVPCQIDIYDNDSRIHSPAFTVYVEENVIDDAEIESTDDFSALASAMTQANQYRTKWSNVSVTAQKLEPDEDPTGAVNIGADGVTFSFGIPQGETGSPAYSGSEPGCLVETTDDGILAAGRKLRVGVDDPEDDVELRDGDLYVQIDPQKIILYSSTEGSEKKFAITVNDAGVLTATEV